MNLSGSFIQMKGFGFALLSAMNPWITCLSSWRERKTPRLRRRLARSANKPSTALSQGGRGEVEDKAGMATQPFQNFGMLMRGIVVDDDVDGQFCRETLTYYAFPEETWRRIRTNDPLERILREI